MISERISLDSAELLLLRDWLPAQQAARLFEQLQGGSAWEQSSISIAGKSLLIPRLNAWYGDQGMDYRYSGTRFEALPWTPPLQDLRERVQAAIDDLAAGDFVVNSALLNLYRDGADSVGWHSDNEKELGPQPQIASVSLGASRRFVFKHRRDKTARGELLLESGSLLLMLGDMQRNWLHAVPKTRKPVGSRINITFRQIMPA